MIELLLGLLSLFLAVSVPIGTGLGIVAFLRSKRQGNEIAALRRALQSHERQFAEMRQSPAGERAGPASTVTAVEPAESTPPVAASPPTAPTPPIPPSPPPAPAAMAAKPAPARPADGGWEQALGLRWLVWLGAATAALGGAFLVKYTIDLGLVGPTVRVSAGFFLGLALALGGEWLRQRPLRREAAAIRPDYVPPALTGVGLFIAFASVYAAFGLYNLISPLMAFVLLAALAAAGVALSLLQGPFIALLGLVGGMVTPLLVPSDQPSAWALFTYLIFLIAGTLAAVRYMRWWRLAWASLAGAFAWPLLWFATSWQDGNAVPIGAYLLLLAALHLFLRPLGEAPPLSAVTGLASPELVAWAGAVAAAVLAFALVRMDSYGGGSLAVLSLLGGFYLAYGWREPAFDGLGPLAAASTLAAVAAWHLPEIISTSGPLYTIEGRAFGRQPGPVVPPELVPFLSAATGFSALFGAGGFVALWRARRPPLWAAVSTTTPTLLLALAYWRAADFTVDVKWAAVALLLAGLNVAAAARVERYRGRPGYDLALAAYAAAACAAVSLAITMILREAWLSVALSLQLPALAWIYRRLELGPLRRVALTIAAIVLARLALNPYVAGYEISAIPLLDWSSYGYGIPAIAFFLAAREFRRAADDNLVLVLEGGALLFASLLVTVEIHHLVTGPLSTPRSGLLETSLQSLAWLTIAIALAASPRWSERAAALWGRRALAVLAMLQVVVVQMLFENPLWSNLAVGEWPLVNLLFLAYAAPAALILIHAWIAGDPPPAGLAARAGALVLLFVYFSLEVRRAYQGPQLGLDATSDAEWYTYSAVWLAYAGALFALGVRFRQIGLRYAALIVLLLTVAKVFLSDMANLTGLYRAVSFLGLGFSLIGIGYLYQQFVFPLHTRPAAGARPIPPGRDIP